MITTLLIWPRHHDGLVQVTKSGLPYRCVPDARMYCFSMRLLFSTT
jgi:hypothetical protein